jgi:hypothetical protein
MTHYMFLFYFQFHVLVICFKFMIRIDNAINMWAMFTELSWVTMVEQNKWGK